MAEKKWKFEVESDNIFFWYLYPAGGKEIEDAVGSSTMDVSYETDFFKDYYWRFGWMGLAYTVYKKALEDCIEDAEKAGYEIDPNDVEIVDLPEMERGWDEMWKDLTEEDDEIRDRLNAEMAPCEPWRFLEAFIEAYNTHYAPYDSLMEMTHQESGIIIYGNGDIMVHNWSWDFGMPHFLSMIGSIGFGKIPHEQKKEEIEDLKEFLDENGREVIEDENNDIPMIYSSEEKLTGTAYYLDDDIIVIAPDDWN